MLKVAEAGFKVPVAADAAQAFATCEEVPVAAAYAIDSGTQQWSRAFRQARSAFEPEFPISTR